MRTSKWMITAALLVSMSAAAQQAADPQSAQPPAQSPAPVVTPTGDNTAAQAAPADGSQPAATQPSQATAQSLPEPTPPPAQPAPVTMDQVVNLFILREHGLIKMLSARTPVVETYLQNLTSDPQLGPIPSDDHYFLGRLDMGETVDRKDYLKDDEKEGMKARLLGGFHKLYKVEYQPVGFSWMVYVDRTDFDREHYDFTY